MAECSRCWNDAYILVEAVGGQHIDHYQKLLDERGQHDHKDGA